MKLPAPTTLGLAVFVVVLSLLGLRPAGPLSDALLAGLTGLLGLAWVTAWRTGRGGVVVRRRLPRVATKGDALTLVHEVEAPPGRLVRDLAVAELDDAHRRVATFFPHVLPGTAAEAATRLFLGERGRVRLSGVVLRSGDPFGLFVLEEERALPGEVLVRPRPSAAAGRLALSRLRTRGVGAPEAGWTGVREWRAGDPVRLVHWRLTARRGFPVVKTLPRRADRTVVLVLDRTPRPGARNPRLEFERAVAQAAGVGQAALAEGPVRFLAPGEEAPLDLGEVRGRTGAAALLEALALVGPDPVGLGALPAGVAAPLVVSARPDPGPGARPADAVWLRAGGRP